MNPVFGFVFLSVVLLPIHPLALPHCLFSFSFSFFFFVTIIIINSSPFSCPSPSPSPFIFFGYAQEELKILQCTLSLVSTLPDLQGELLSKVVVTCFRLHFNKDATTMAIGAATLRQVVGVVFDRVDKEDTTVSRAMVCYSRLLMLFFLSSSLAPRGSRKRRLRGIPKRRRTCTRRRRTRSCCSRTCAC